MAKTMVALLLTMHPELARPPNEHRQAEAIYTAASGEIKVSQGETLALIRHSSRCHPLLLDLLRDTSSGAPVARATPRPRANGSAPFPWVLPLSTQTDVPGAAVRCSSGARLLPAHRWSLPRWSPAVCGMVRDAPSPHADITSDRLSPAGGPSSSTCGICGEGFCGDAVGDWEKRELTP